MIPACRPCPAGRDDEKYQKTKSDVADVTFGFLIQLLFLLTIL